MSSFDYLDLCRLCLVKDQVSVPIFEGDGDARQIFHKISFCLPVKVDREDKLPKKICDDCAYKVELCYQFYNTTANAEKQLLQWLGEVGLEDKQDYEQEVMNSEMMKQEPDNRINVTVLSSEEQSNNMEINMIDGMSLSLPIIMTNQQMPAVSMSSTDNLQTIQSVAGTSVQTTRRMQKDGHEEIEDTEEDDNSEDECDVDEGMQVVKEESENSTSGSRSMEPTTFVNVALCNEAGPSGLQQQKLGDMTEMSIQQSSEGDTKTGVKQRKDSLILEPTKMITRSQSKKSSPRATQVRAINNYFCDKCNINFPLENMLNRHKVFHNISQRLNKMVLRKMVPKKLLNQRREFNCRLCQFTCDNQEELIAHREREHTARVDEDEDEINEDLDISGGEFKIVTQEELLAELKGFENPQIPSAADVIAFESIQEEALEDGQQGQEGVIDEQALPLDENSSGSEDETIDEEALDEELLQEKEFQESIGQLQCDSCEFQCANKNTMYSHKRRHRILENENLILSCDECGYKAIKKSSLHNHIFKKHTMKSNAPEVYNCSLCEYKNKNKYELKIHIARKHTQDYKFTCEFCGKKFKVKGDLTNHVRFSHKEQPVICDVCGKTCLNSNSLYVHQKFAHYKAQFECHICKRRMVTQENLNEHMIRQHEKREKAVCDECGKSFSRNSRLKIHMRIHTGDRPYVCQICSKTFIRRTALKQHLLIHTGIKPYVCDICGKAFTQKPGLISHRKSHPGNHPPLPRVLIDHLLGNIMTSK
ncbi:zinc finger protein 62 homolog isoform X2 [Microplitis mediator]|uniref:zinc finger protein 62 homolog isoform X2 n=1 Tax=Microplitis mediator TaxID=375433 RepID=UPI002552C29C|nr:zinc finger protein 62 homolog isoform X2 [Microplitis mediator]